MGHGTVVPGRRQPIFIRKEFQGPLAALVTFLVLFALLGASGQTSRKAEAALEATHQQLQDFLLTWYAWRAERSEGGAGTELLWARCQRQARAIQTSPIWGPMWLLKRLPPGALPEFQRQWEAVADAPSRFDALETATSFLLTKVDQFGRQQRAVDGILEVLIWAASGFLLVVSGFLVWN